MGELEHLEDDGLKAASGDRGHEDKVKALFNRLTNGGTELGWRRSQREEEDYGTTTEGKNEMEEEEVEKGADVCVARKDQHWGRD